MIDYNKFYLVSFDVAKALKDIHYSEETLHHYIFDGKDVHSVSFGGPKKSLKIDNYETFTAPTQGYLMRELRDRFKLLVTTMPVKSSKFKGIKYGFSIFDLNLDNVPNEDWILAGADYYTNTKFQYDKQEDAIDAGLLEALNILKQRNIFWNSNK